MTYMLHMSGVITGCLNCFCLACDVFLKSPQDATEHVGTAEHQKKANAVQFTDKFKDEHIKKFKWGYYCEFCNVLKPTTSKVNLHVTEDEHKHNKGLLLLKPTGLDVVAFNNVLIEERAWHGLIEGVCSLCNTEFEDENDHKIDPGHSLNLVLKPIQFVADNAIFRPLDDTAVQCLTCNKLLAPGRMDKHLDDSEHHELYVKQCIQTKEVSQASEAQEKAVNMTSVIENDDEIKKPKVDNDAIEKTTSEDNNNNEKSPIKDKSKILESISKYQTKGININLETETAFCKKCSEVVTFDLIEIDNHIENHSSAVDSDLLYPSNLDQNLNRVDINDKTTQSSENKHEVVNDILKGLQENVQNDSSNDEDYDTISICSVDDSDNTPAENFEKGSQEEEASKFAKANKITYTRDNDQAFCRICKVRVPASFRSMKEHTEGANHKRLVASSKSLITQPKAPIKLSKQKTIEFIDSAYYIRGLLYTAIMVNEKYCLLLSSFNLVYFGSHCYLCDINLPRFSDGEDHVKTSHHQDRWQRVPVITSERNEFIREVRPGMYHCGYCHFVVSGWTNMKQHLDCYDHQDSRMNWETRMRIHLPGVQQHIMQEKLESLVMSSFFNV